MTAAELMERGQELRNMSAPPRSTLTLHPFRLPEGRPAAPAEGTPTNWGLAWYARVHFDWILRDQWPQWGHRLGGCAGSAGRQAHIRLWAAVALARGQDLSLDDPWNLDARLDEELADELLGLAPALARMGTLPSLMLATRAVGQGPDPDPDPVRTLAVLTHLTGRTCDPGGAPLLSQALRDGLPIDLWIPEAAHG
jgi:hypothetical protein